MRSVERDLVGSADNMASEPQQVLGEADDRAYRNPLCTSVLIRTRNRAIVDPSLQPAGMASLLDRRPGLSLSLRWTPSFLPTFTATIASGKTPSRRPNG
jgi:hypothetical protein